jgi:uncharacterized protein (DUF952 family)
MIFHIADPALWLAANETYKPAPFDREGFIHCSTAAQLDGTLRKHFSGMDEVLLLAIDTEAEKDYIRFEDLYGSGQEFPHVYRPLPVASVLDTFLLSRGESGDYKVPHDWLNKNE